jgi:hypothetical protein
MYGWAERQLGRKTDRKQSPLTLVGAPKQDPAVTSGLKSEPVIPRRGTWGQRLTQACADAAYAETQAQTEADAANSSAGRVRWNLTA